MKYLIIVFGLLLAFPVRAQVSVETFCQLLPEYEQPDGVEYQPGVDVNGKVVVPADLNNPAPLQDFESIEIPVVADLIKKFDPDVPWGTELKPDVALISIHKDGRVDYNGHDISKQAYALCSNKDAKNEQAGPAKPK